MVYDHYIYNDLSAKNTNRVSTESEESCYLKYDK